MIRWRSTQLQSRLQLHEIWVPIFTFTNTLLLVKAHCHILCDFVQVDQCNSIRLIHLNQRHDVSGSYKFSIASPHGKEIKFNQASMAKHHNMISICASSVAFFNLSLHHYEVSLLEWGWEDCSPAWMTPNAVMKTPEKSGGSCEGMVRMSAAFPSTLTSHFNSTSVSIGCRAELSTDMVAARKLSL